LKGLLHSSLQRYLWASASVFVNWEEPIPVLKKLVMIFFDVPLEESVGDILVAVGGDPQHPEISVGTCAISTDGSLHWSAGVLNGRHR
jgi:hypothetical protein